MGAAVVRTAASGQAYIDLCQNQTHRVPVPSAVLDSTWENHFALTVDFAGGTIRGANGTTTTEPELWSWKTPPGHQNPGYCVALPRWVTDAGGLYNKALVFGIICVSLTTSHACFFDNPNGLKLERYMPHSISLFSGGADLYSNGQGVCSGCHAGRNPIVVHPHDEAFRSLKRHITNLNPPDKFIPILPQAPAGQDEWPENPPSLTVLPPSAAAGDCIRCHTAGGSDGAGPLPRFWDLPRGDYCETVLKPAIALDVGASTPTTPVGQTMPTGNELPSSGTRTPRPDRTPYLTHINWLDSLCDAPWDGRAGEVQTDPPSASILEPTPPVLLGPIYACVTSVEVSGVIPGTTLEVVSAAAGGSIGSATPTEAGKLTIPLTSALVAQDTLEVEVYRGGVKRGTSNARTVLAPPTQAPPAPSIAGPVHQCASRLGVFKIRGAQVTMTRNGSPPVVQQSDSYYAIFNLASAIQGGTMADEFEVTQSVCGSPESAPAEAVATIFQGPIPRARFPEKLYVGQDEVDIFGLTTGSEVELWNSSVPGAVVSSSSWPFSSLRAGTGGTMSSSYLWVRQRLCGGGWFETSIDEDDVVDCSPGAPPPDVAPPQAGDVVLIITETIPGGVAHLWINGSYIASTGGGIFTLPSPLVAGDVVVVSQSVGTCSGERGVSWVVQ